MKRRQKQKRTSENKNTVPPGLGFHSPVPKEKAQARKALHMVFEPLQRVFVDFAPVDLV